TPTPCSLSLHDALPIYAGWYPRQWLPNGAGKIDNLHETLLGHVNCAARTSKRLARGLFHAMARFGPKLDREQLLLSRFVGIATRSEGHTSELQSLRHLV